MIEMPRSLVLMIIIAVVSMVIEMLVVQRSNQQMSQLGLGSDTREKSGTLNLFVLVVEVVLAVVSAIFGAPGWVKVVGIGFAAIWAAIYVYLLLSFYHNVYGSLSKDNFMRVSFPRYLFEDMMGKKMGLYTLSMIAVIANWLVVA